MNRLIKSNESISSNKKIVLSILFLFFFTFPFNAVINAINPSPESLQIQHDSINFPLKDSLNQVLDFSSDYMAQAELEHQKLLRNIFMVSFFFVLALLIFTMVFYGSKIKKVSNIIVLQNDALLSTKDQLIKIIGLFNYIDQQVYITDSKGIVEWANAFASKFFKELYEENKINLLTKFSKESQGVIFQAINDNKHIVFKDDIYEKNKDWKMIPVKNSKGEFSNIVFIS